MHKLVISLPISYDSICYVIDHSKDLDTIEVHEVVALLKGYEHRHVRHIDNRTEKAFASLSVRPKQAKFTGNQNIKYQKNRKTKGQKWNNKPNFFFLVDISLLIKQERKLLVLMVLRISAGFVTNYILGNAGSRENPNAIIVTRSFTLPRTTTTRRQCSISSIPIR